MTRLAVILCQGFADWECAHLMAAGRTHFSFDVGTATPGGEKVVSSGGLQVTPDMALEALDPADIDALAICGGSIWQSPSAPDLAPIVKGFIDKRVLVGAICDGVLGLARMGALNTRAHTGNDLDTLKGASGYSGDALFRDVPGAVRADGIVTAAGTAPVTFMAEMMRGLGYGSSDLDYYLGLLAAEHAG